MSTIEIVEMDLAEGRVVLVPVQVVGDSGPTDVGLPEHAAWAEVAETIHDVGAVIWSALGKLSPHRASVEFGLDVGAKAGKLTALLVEGNARATLKVKLEWERTFDGPSAPAAPDSGTDVEAEEPEPAPA